MGHMPRELSGGQQQRVAIARALINSPEIIFADEPTGNLDSNTGIEIMKLLQEVNRESNKTIIMVTHSADAAAYSNRIVSVRDNHLWFFMPFWSYCTFSDNVITGVSLFDAYINPAKFGLRQAMVSGTHPAAKGIPEGYDIFFVSSRHIECCVLLSKM